MSFTYVPARKLSASEAGFGPDIVGSLLGGYEKVINDKYLQPTLEQELQKLKLYNQYYGPDIESQIGLRGAQAKQANAHTGLLSEQTKGARLENQYFPQYKQAQIAQLNAQAEKARLIQMIREQMLGGGVSGMQGQSAPGMQEQGGTPMQMFQGQGMPRQQQMGQPQEIPQQQRQMRYPQQAIISQLLGLGMPKIENVNGRYMAIGPLGASDIGVSGLTEMQKNLSKEDAKKISKLEDTVLSGQQKQDTFNELNEDLGSPEFEALRRHPALGKHELGYYEKFGTPQQQGMIGRIKTHMGNIIKDSARDFAGQFRIGEQALLRSMKPNEEDSLDVMKGKSAALTYMNMIMSQRAEIEADLMRNQGMSPLQARIAANKQINPKAIKDEVNAILHPASSNKIKFNHRDLEYTAKKHGMTIDEVRRRLEAKNA